MSQSEPSQPKSGFRAKIGWLLVPLLPLAIVLTAPATRWIARTHVETLTRPPNEIGALLHDLGVQHELAKERDSHSASERARRIVDNSPTDYRLQLAYAIMAASQNSQAQSLRILARRFPDRPGLYAHILRYDTLQTISLRHKEPRPPAPQNLPVKLPPPTPPSAQALAAFDVAAVQGARLDPQNAYFPFIRSVGLFAANRDREAVESIKLASAKATWDDYASEEMRATLHLYDGVWGRTSFLNRVAAPAATLFPHYASLRAATRVAVDLAGKAERTHRAREGIEIRHAIMRIASIMRPQSSTNIGSLVAVALARVAASRIENAPRVEKPPTISADRWNRQQFGKYLEFLKRHGFRDPAEWTAREYEAGNSVRQIAQQGLGRSVMGGAGMSGAVLLWSAGMILFANALWMWLIGGILTLLVQGGASRRSIVFISLVGFLLLIPVAFSLARWSEALAALVSALANLTDSGTPLPPLFARIVTVILALLLPILTLLTILVAAAFRARMNARTVAILTMPVALLLFIAHAGVTAATSDREARLNAELDSIITHEGKTLAKLLGKPWPAALN